MKKSILLNENEWWEALPDEIQASIVKTLEQSEANQTMPHSEAMKPYLKWLKKPTRSKRN